MSERLTPEQLAELRARLGKDLGDFYATDYMATITSTQVHMLLREIDALTTANVLLAAEVAEWKQSFELYHSAIRRGTALWREATGRDDVLPDVGDLVWWLLTKHVLHAQDIAKLRRKLTCLISEVRIFGNISGDLAEALTISEQVLNETKEDNARS